MDPKLEALLSRQQADRFRGLSGSDVRAAIRVSAELLNEAIRTYVAAASAVREIAVTPRAGNRFDVHVQLAKSFLPAINLTVAIEQQPELPDRPTLALHVIGGGTLLRFAGPAVNAFAGRMPPGVRMVGDRIFVDLRDLLRARGQQDLLAYAQDLAIGTEESVLMVLVHARVT